MRPRQTAARRFEPAGAMPAPRPREAGLFAPTPPLWSSRARARQDPRLLIIDADETHAGEAAARLSQHGLSITVAGSPEAADALLAAQAFDLVVLEPRLEGRDGLAFCRELAARTRAPILIFSAADDPLDRVAGLEFGADDYLGKSAHPLELIARIRALLRRGAREAAPAAAGPPAYVFQGLSFEPRARALVGPGGRRVWLTTSEAGLLQVFLAAPGEMLSRSQLQARLFGSDAHLSDRAIDVRVVRLRRALDQAGAAGADLIRTCRGGGYLLAADVAAV
jgi:DNA-binding response OmpR family regulator